MKNTEVSNHLKLIAQLRALNGDSSFSVRAYENAIKSIGDLDYLKQDIATTNLKSIGGIGPGIRSVIEEFLKTGTSAKLNELSSKWPIEALTMTVVQGIGPKRAFKLWQEGIKNFSELSALAYSGGLDAKLRDAVLIASKNQGRVPYAIAKNMADKILAKVLDIPGVFVSTICGSIRRKTPTSKDIDIACMIEECANRTNISNAFGSLGEDFIGGEKKASIAFSYGDVKLRTDLWIGERAHYGALINHCTGSKEHNIKLRTLAVSKGLSVNEYGIYRGEEKLGGENEHDLYSVLGIDYVEPENRR